MSRDAEHDRNEWDWIRRMREIAIARAEERDRRIAEARAERAAPAQTESGPPAPGVSRTGDDQGETASSNSSSDDSDSTPP